MKLLKYILLCISFSAVGQSSIEVEFVLKTPLKTDLLVEIDNFGDLYSVKNNEFIRKTQNKSKPAKLKV